jgi:hypothetical protein
MPKSILATLTILCTLSCSNLTLPASAAQSRCQLAPNSGISVAPSSGTSVAPSNGTSVAIAGKKCGLKRVYSRPKYR